MALPTAATVRASQPNVTLGWFVDARFRELVQDNPHIDTVFAFDRGRFRGRELDPFSWRLYWKNLMQPRRFNPDVVICLRGHLRETISVAFSGAKERYTLQPRGMLATLLGGKAVHPEKDRHVVERFLDVVEAAGFSKRIYDFYLPISPEDSKFVDSRLGSGGWVTLHLGSGDPKKVWPPERYAIVAERLRAEGLRVVLLGGPGEEPLRDRFLHFTKAEDFVGRTTLLQLAETIRRSRLHISNDSGSAHIAAALGVPCVTIFGRKRACVYHPFRQPEAVIEAGGNVLAVQPEEVVEKCFERLELAPV